MPFSSSSSPVKIPFTRTAFPSSAATNSNVDSNKMVRKQHMPIINPYMRQKNSLLNAYSSFNCFKCLQQPSHCNMPSFSLDKFSVPMYHLQANTNLNMVRRQYMKVKEGRILLINVIPHKEYLSHTL